MIPEDRLKAAVVKAAMGQTTLEDEIERLLGKPWDDELEPFRYAGGFRDPLTGLIVLDGLVYDPEVGVTLSGGG